MRIPAEHVQRVRDVIGHGVDVVETGRAVAVVDDDLDSAEVEPGGMGDALRSLDDFGSGGDGGHAD
ncbi:MAG: hypothetical protein QOF05_320, partial [Sphingomonadales bacterium]|nr:hypothetical protein [Sphingomonadales bacterium]